MAEVRTIRFRLNGEPVSAHVGAHENLVEVLQGQFGLAGARESCGQGLCGCCTVLVNGAAVSGCLYLAAFADGAEIETIERTGSGGLDAVQKAFIECGAFQCGFCTPGFIMASVGLLEKFPNPTPEQIRKGLDGNICRCGTFNRIFEAVSSVKGVRRG